MTKKKQGQQAISRGENEQAQTVLARYHQIAKQVQASSNEQQTVEALAEINNLPAGAQFALLKELAKEQEIDAADVLAAVHAFGTLKDARKEARRSLIRLEGAKVYPGWEAPQTPAFEESAQSTVTIPPRFFKGLITDSYESGEMQLILSWEIGEDYREVRMLVFLLEFWHDGIKDFFTQVESKRSFANLLPRIAASLDDVSLKECTLENGIRLLEEARAVNAKYGTKPHRDYARHLALINQFIPERLVTQVMGTIGEHDEEEDEVEIDLSDLTPVEMVTTFIENLVEDDLFLAYQTLAHDSPLREDLTKQAWVERRREWIDQFLPGKLHPGFVHLREAPRSKIWLPGRAKKNSATTAEVDAGWSVEFEELPQDADRPQEWPTPLIVYPLTGRHWFWASFTLVQENDAWRIQSMTDEAAKALALSVEDVKKEMSELDRRWEKTTGHLNPARFARMNDAEQMQTARELLLPIAQMIYYHDVLSRIEPQNRKHHADAAGLAILLPEPEHRLVHLEALVERFPEEHLSLYQRIAEAHRQVAEEYAEDALADEEDELFHLEQAEKALFAALELEENVDTRISIAEILLQQGQRLDEAKSQLLLAKKETDIPEEEAHIELHLGEIAEQQEQPELALLHFQRTTELQPENTNYWETLARAQQEQELFEEAEASYKRAIELEPHEVEHYSNLGLFYRDIEQPMKAIQVLKDGLAANPDSAPLHAILATAYIMGRDFQQAEKLLAKAERLEPGSEAIAELREMLTLEELTLPSISSQPLKLTRPKKKKRHH
ncbi:MAG TPA: tetratricopeptide repeat protein [Ktedonobacteraceae bacterium]